MPLRRNLTETFDSPSATERLFEVIVQDGNTVDSDFPNSPWGNSGLVALGPDYGSALWIHRDKTGSLPGYYFAASFMILRDGQRDGKAITLFISKPVDWSGHLACWRLYFRRDEEGQQNLVLVIGLNTATNNPSGHVYMVPISSNRPHDVSITYDTARRFYSWSVDGKLVVSAAMPADYPTIATRIIGSSGSSDGRNSAYLVDNVHWFELPASGARILEDSGAHLATLTPGQIAAMAGDGISRIDASDNRLVLSVAQYRALGGLALTAGDRLSLVDRGAALASLSATEIGSLDARGIDRIEATDGALDLTVAQYDALGSVALTAGDSVTLADRSAALEALTPGEIRRAARHGVDVLGATDGALALSVAQFEALGCKTVAPADVLSLSGTPGNDRFVFSHQTFEATDRIEGGAGIDTLVLDGNYAAGLAFGPSTIDSIERLKLVAGHSYKLTLADGDVAAGQSLTVDAGGLRALDSLTFDGAAETHGRLVVTGGSGADQIVGGADGNIITGGDGADRITAGAGADTLRYTAACQSSGTGYDTVIGFDAAFDRFDVGHLVAGVDCSVSGALSSSSFDAQMAKAVDASRLPAGTAAEFLASSGNLSGQTFLVVDMNGIAGYQPGADLVIRQIDLVGTITARNFT